MGRVTPAPGSAAHPVQPVTGTRLDPWIDSYADRTHGMRASEIRALFAVANRPEVVSLAGGMPYLEGLPLEALAESAHELILKRGTTALQYGSGQGDETLREQILEIMRIEGIHAHPDDVVVTTGSQQALDLVTRLFVNPGDVVVAEAPSYVGALGVFRSYQADVVHVPAGRERPDPRGARRDAHAPRGRAPPGQAHLLRADVPQPRRRLALPGAPAPDPRDRQAARRPAHRGQPVRPARLRRRAVPGDAVDGGRPASSTSARSPRRSRPGTGSGWAVAPPSLREKLVLASESAILCPSNASQLAVSTYLTNHDWRGQIKAYREMYRERRDAMVGALAEYMPESSWTVPEGGFYTWVKLPDGIDARAMLPRAVTALVAYVSGTAFYADGQGSDHMRLSFCYPPPERIREGVRRLAGVVSEELELVQIFGTDAHPESEQVQMPGPDSA